MEVNLGELWEIVEDRGALCTAVSGVAGAWCTAVNGVAKSQTFLRDQITTKLLEFLNYEGYMCYLKMIYNSMILYSVTSMRQITHTFFFFWLIS